MCIRAIAVTVTAAIGAKRIIGAISLITVIRINREIRTIKVAMIICCQSAYTDDSSRNH